MAEHSDSVTCLGPAAIQNALYQARDGFRRWREGFVPSSPLQQLLERSLIGAFLRCEYTALCIDFGLKVTGFDEHHMYPEWTRLEFEDFHLPLQARICSRCKAL